MTERFLFDRIDTKARGAAIAGQYHGAVLDPAHKTKAALTLSQFAKSRAKVALNPAITQTVPETARHHRKILIRRIYRCIHGYLVPSPYIFDKSGRRPKAAA
jgi:hypothetical protein